MKIIDYLKENHSAMRSGLPIELRDLIDERSVYTGSYEGMLNCLEMVGLAHVKNAAFVMDDIDNRENRIVLYYVKDIKEYDDFDLRQFAARVKGMEKQLASLRHMRGYSTSTEQAFDTVITKAKAEGGTVAHGTSATKEMDL